MGTKYSIDNDNRVAVGNNGETFPIDGTFSVDEDNRLNYWLNEPESWLGKKVQKTGLIPIPKGNEEFIGGHAICIVGFNDAKQIFKFKNSWSAKWADKGYGYLPYKYFKRYCRA